VPCGSGATKRIHPLPEPTRNGPSGIVAAASKDDLAGQNVNFAATCPGVRQDEDFGRRSPVMFVNSRI
jgi:hypothetical protein